MKNILFLLIAVLGFAACRDGVNADGKANLDLTFKAKFGEETLVLGDYYDYANGNTINFSKVNFFISEITLLNGSEETEITDIALVNLDENHSSSSTAANGETISIDKIPDGEYTGIKFGIGVAPALNTQNPADFSNSHPLSDVANYWEWRESYIFTKLEGHVDTVGNSGKLDVFFVYHPGEESYYKTITINEPISLSNKETTDLNLIFDVRKLFFDEGTTFDITVDNQSHTGVDDAWIVDQIMGNYGSAFTVE